MNESFTPPKQRDTRRFVPTVLRRVPTASRLPRCCFLRSSLDVCFPNSPPALAFHAHSTLAPRVRSPLAPAGAQGAARSWRSCAGTLGDHRKSRGRALPPAAPSPPRWSPNSARWSACARSRRLRRTSRSSCTPAPRKPEPPRRAGRAASHPLTRPLQREHAAAQARADGRWARRDDPAEDGGHGAVQLGQGPDWLLDDHRG